MFYFGLFSIILLGVVSFGSDGLAQFNAGSQPMLLSSFSGDSNQAAADPYFNQNSAHAMETPDLKITQDNFVYGVATPRVFSTQTLGAMMGGASNQDQNRKDVVDYTVQVGDTAESIANSFGLSVNTVAWANDISKNTTLKTGQSLIILPVDGVLHIVKSGDTIAAIAKTYKAKTQDIIDINGLSDEGDVFIGDILMVPGGVMPQKGASITVGIGAHAALPDSFFIYPIEGVITQGLHYFNAVDIANNCGTPVYAAAAGTVQRAVANGAWNFGMGNYITILHTGGVSSYYGHLLSLFVKPGDQVNVGDRIGLVGKTGEATGCHVHFQVMGAANPLAKYLVGSKLRYSGN